MLQIIGGILLILGAWYTYKGNMFAAIATFVGEGLVWFILSIQDNELSGAVLVMIGIIANIVVYVKMHKGEFHKSIAKDR